MYELFIRRVVTSYQNRIGVLSEEFVIISRNTIHLQPSQLLLFSLMAASSSLITHHVLVSPMCLMSFQLFSHTVYQACLCLFQIWIHSQIAFRILHRNRVHDLKDILAFFTKNRLLFPVVHLDLSILFDIVIFLNII